MWHWLATVNTDNMLPCEVRTSRVELRAKLGTRVANYIIKEPNVLRRCACRFAGGEESVDFSVLERELWWRSASSYKTSEKSFLFGRHDVCKAPTIARIHDTGKSIEQPQDKAFRSYSRNTLRVALLADRSEGSGRKSKITVGVRRLVDEKWWKMTIQRQRSWRVAIGRAWPSVGEITCNAERDLGGHTAWGRVYFSDRVGPDRPIQKIGRSELLRNRYKCRTVGINFWPWSDHVDVNRGMMWSSLALVLYNPIHACTCAKKWNTCYCESPTRT